MVVNSSGFPSVRDVVDKYASANSTEIFDQIKNLKATTVDVRTEYTLCKLVTNSRYNTDVYAGEKYMYPRYHNIINHKSRCVNNKNRANFFFFSPRLRVHLCLHKRGSKCNRYVIFYFFLTISISPTRHKSGNV